MQEIVHQVSSWQQLQQLTQQRSQEFTAQHCAAALHRLAAVWQQQQQLAAQEQQQVQLRVEVRLQLPSVMHLAAVLLHGLQQQMQDAEARDLADALYAMVKLGWQSGHWQQQQQQQRLTAADGMLPSPPGFAAALTQHSQALMKAGRFKALQLSRVLWGLACLNMDLGPAWWATTLDAAAVLLQQEEQRGLRQSAALIGWSVAKLRGPATAAWWTCYMTVTQQLMDSDNSSSSSNGNSSRHSGRLSGEGRPERFTSQNLSNVIWALAAAQQRPTADWLSSFYAASGQVLPEFTPQGLSNTLHALAVLQQQPPEHWMQQYEVACLSQMNNFSFQNLCMVFWAFGRISRCSSSNMQQQRCFPSAAWLDQALPHLLRSADAGGAPEVK
jgi:hypothetical protein